MAVVLGLAIATSEHHAAALVIDGQVVGAVEEERLSGVKHYGWVPPGHAPGANLINTPGLKVRDAICRRAVAALLEPRGLTARDVDVLAVNGMPYRYARQGVREVVREGRYLFVPHHLCHAALAARTSPHGSGWVLTVDGRGEYETAALFDYRDGELRRRDELLAGGGCSIGGAYETVTRALGFGPHGQGQTMALAAFGAGDPRRLASAFGVESFGSARVDEAALAALASARLGGTSGWERPAARDLAADLQAATEAAVVGLARAAWEEAPERPWMLAGGVALNCRANSVLRDTLGVEVWVPSAAHDAGTALGAALEAARVLGEPVCGPLWEAGLGPAFDDAACEAAVRAEGLVASEVGGDWGPVVERLLDGRVLGWLQGGVEFGPRALGQRSIVAHPGLAGIKDRVNRVKDRQAWRPFGPSVLEERAGQWFEGASLGPFMTFTEQVRPERRAEVEAILHVDGSTRPQAVSSVAGRVEPRWRQLIEAFEAATGVPMVLNTSFNGRGEPIVCDPRGALESARRIGLDGVVLGRLLVDLGGRGA